MRCLYENRGTYAALFLRADFQEPAPGGGGVLRGRPLSRPVAGLRQALSRGRGGGPGGGGGDEQRPEVLVASADEALVLALRVALQRRGIGLRRAGNFWLAMSALRSFRFQGLVLDLAMPTANLDFLLDFLEEEAARRLESKVFLAREPLPELVANRLKGVGHFLLHGEPSPRLILRALGADRSSLGQD